MRLRERGEQATFATDTHAHIAAEIAAALQISRTWAESYLYYARAMRLRLPKVGDLDHPRVIPHPGRRSTAVLTGTARAT